MEQGKKLSGRVYSIQRYCIHDGPGIRTDVFLKGCALRCPWCCNPESQSPARELAFSAGKCTGCGSCFRKCPSGALRRDGEGFRIDKEKCTLCGLCVRYCPRDCYKLYGEEYTPEALLEEVLKDEIFYRNSGGGVTVTGGEPLMQLEFVTAFLKLCTQSGLDTAMETHGFNETEKYRQVAPYVRHFLIDLKHTDLQKCHAVTRSPLQFSPMENIRVLTQECGCEVSIRVPVIPGFNDDEQNFRALAAFGKTLLPTGKLKMIHLLPYHNLGAGKYETLDLRYPMPEVKPLEDEALLPHLALLEAALLPCMIGG